MWTALSVSNEGAGGLFDNLNKAMAVATEGVKAQVVPCIITGCGERAFPTTGACRLHTCTECNQRPVRLQESDRQTLCTDCWRPSPVNGVVEQLERITKAVESERRLRGMTYAKVLEHFTQSAYDAITPADFGLCEVKDCEEHAGPDYRFCAKHRGVTEEGSVDVAVAVVDTVANMLGAYTCRFTKCQDRVMDGKRYCAKHQCTVEGCLNAKQYGDKDRCVAHNRLSPKPEEKNGGADAK